MKCLATTEANEKRKLAGAMTARQALDKKTITPTPGTPTASFRGKRGRINGVTVWLKGQSPSGNGDYSRSPYHERAAYIVDEALGLRLVPPTILHLRDGKLVSAMKWVRGATPNITPRPPLLDMFDYLIANGDRHGGNWLVKPSGRVWAIDNAMSFYTRIYDYDVCNVQLPERVKRNMRAIVKHPRKLHQQLKRLLDESQITALLERMKKILESIT